MPTPWGHVDVGSVVAVATIVALLAIAIPVFIWSHRVTQRVNRAVDQMNARQLPEWSTAAAQTGTPRTFQIGQGLSLTITPLRVGMRISVSTKTLSGTDMATAYPITDELAGEIAAKLQRGRD